MAATVVTLLRTLWPRPVGQAPHPDGDRYLCQLSRFSLTPTDTAAPRYWEHALFTWVPATSPQPTECVPYPSSQLWFLRGLTQVSEWAGGPPGGIDFRWGIALYSVFAGLMVALFAYTVRRGLATRIVLSVVLLAIITDSTFASYAAGPMGELPGIVGIIVACVGAIYMGTSGFRQWFGLAMFGVGSALLLTSKVQMVTLVVPVVIMLALTTMRRRRRPDDHQNGLSGSVPMHHSVLRTMTGKIAPVLVAAGLLVPTAWMFENNPEDFQVINPWEQISVGIMGHSSDPEADLAEMGFPTSLAKYAGKTACDDGCAVQFDPDWLASKDQMTYGVVGRFLLEHPGRAFTIANTAAKDLLIIRPTYLGSFEPGGGEPQAQDVSFLANVSRDMQALGLGAVILFWTALAVFAGIVWRSSMTGSWRRAYSNAALLMLSFSVIQFVTASYGEAIENTKHMIFAILSGLLGWTMAASAAVAETADQSQSDPDGSAEARHP